MCRFRSCLRYLVLRRLYQIAALPLTREASARVCAKWLIATVLKFIAGLGDVGLHAVPIAKEIAVSR